MTSSMLKMMAAAALAAALAYGAAVAHSSARVAFPRGGSAASVRGTVEGRRFRDHLVAARAGQTMDVSVVGRTAVYFNILPPGSTDEAIYNGAMSGEVARGVRLPATGDYRLRVYLMGAARGDGRPTRYRLSITLR